MSDNIGMTASRSWRQYKKNGGTKNFVEYLNIEKAKLSADGDNTPVLINQTLNDSVHAAIKEAAGVSKPATGKTVFGINKTVFIITTVVFVGGLTYLITTLIKKK